MTKAFIPLESDPQVFTQLAHQLGINKSLAFHDVYSLDEPDLLSFIPRPVEALIVVFPISSDVKQGKDHTNTTIDKSTIWVPQTIKNACGTYALLHAALNGRVASDLSSPLKELAEQLEKANSVNERIQIIESSNEIESAHASVASQGQTDAPPAESNDVNLHYVCFTFNPTTNQILQLDGRENGPVNLAPIAEQPVDMLSPQGINLVKQFIHSNPDTQSLEFSILALAPSLD